MNQGGHFDLDSKKEQIANLEQLILSSSFWDNKKEANEITAKLSRLKQELSDFKKLENEITSAIDLLKLLKTENDKMLEEELQDSLKECQQNIENIEINILLNQEFDNLNCYLEIHPGAGGTESCDWADMLLRMYERFCEKNNFKYEIIDYQKGDEAGIKSVTLLIKGIYAYGYLKCEKGVHRLVRISPFDSNARRHTSFASVSVIPEFDNNVDLQINEKDIKIDVYRSSGKGGQGVNTTDSAVRITHLPTKTVVTCQNERSQLKNKETAMKVLKSKLYQLELEKKEAEINKIVGKNSTIDFGSQIRSYVLEPYQLVKDTRTNYETSQTQKVLDGDILEFIKAKLKKKD